MEELETTNQAEAEADTGVETEVQDEQLLDDDGNPIEEQPEDEDEIDLDEETKLKLPKSQAEKLRQAMLRQADYTRKTQELAEQRKAFDAERQAITQADENELTARANITMIDQQLARYSQVNWAAFNENDPFEAQKAFQQFQLLKDAREQSTRYLGALQGERQSKEQQETAKRMEEGAAAIAKAIPEWSPAHAAKLTDAGQKHFGFSKEDLDGIDDPRVVIALDAAVKWLEHQATTKKTATIQKQQQIVPAAKTASRGNPIPPTKLDDRLSGDEWLRRRNAQLARKG